MGCVKKWIIEIKSLQFKRVKLIKWLSIQDFYFYV